MVKILEKREIQRLLDIGVRLVLCQPGGQVHRHMLVADGGLKLRLVDGLEPVDALLLLLLDASAERQLAAQVIVRAVPVELVFEKDLFHLDAVHQDDADAGVWVDGVLVIRLGVDARPVGQSILHMHGFEIKRIQYATSQR